MTIPSQLEPGKQESLNAAIAACARRFAETRDLDVILRDAVSIIREVIGLDRAGIFLYSSDQATWRGVFGTDVDGAIRDEHRLEMPPDQRHPIHRTERGEGDEFFYEDFAAEFPGDTFMAGVRNCFFIALRAHGKLLGGLSVDNLETGRPIDPATREALRQFTRYIALALENLSLLNHLEEANLQLTSANQDLKDFADIVAHDLTSPLQGVILLLDYLQRRFADYMPEEGRQSLKKAYQRILQMARLLHGILRYSRMSKRTEDLTLVSTGKIVSDVIDLLNVPEGITIEIAPDMPSVLYDEAQLHQVFQNLISNAVKYMGRTQGTVRVSGRRQEHVWEFAIEDNGMGIRPSQMETIFKMFNRGGLEDDGVSSGIGLALVKKIIERGGGTVRAESEMGRGSTFYFTIPLGRKPMV